MTANGKGGSRPPRGRSKHAADCTCTRCRGFQPGNTLELRHGAYAVIDIAEPAAQTAATIRSVIPLQHDADEAVIEVFALVLRRLERACAALDEANGKRTELLRLSQDAQGWTNRALACADALGMTPTSRARLGLTLEKARMLAKPPPPERDLSRLTDTQRELLLSLEARALGEERSLP